MKRFISVDYLAGKHYKYSLAIVEYLLIATSKSLWLLILFRKKIILLRGTRGEVRFLGGL